MMRTKNNFLFIIFIFVFSLFLPSEIFSEETWTIASTSFAYSKGQKQNAVTDAAAAMFPARILENISLALSRAIADDESLDRLRYKSKNERTSLFLQMSSLVQKRDALFLENYSEKDLKKKIHEQEDAIQDLRDKINQNIEDLKNEEEKYEEKITEDTEEESGFSKLIDDFKDLLASQEDSSSSEKIVFYKNDINALFKPSEVAEKENIGSKQYEKEVLAAGIDGILTGTLVSYGDFVSLTVEVYSFPGSRKIGQVTEIGSLSDADYISKSIARQLVPVITNSLPITVGFETEPENLRQKTSLYVDEQFFSELPANLVLESGVHRLEFIAEGFKRIATSYYFEGNHLYKIKANMEPESSSIININLKNPVEGDLFANGLLQKNITVFESVDGNICSDSTSITVNGKTILGEFIDKNGSSAFYYISQEKLKNAADFTINLKTFDRSEHIERQRKSMYSAYSALVLSMIPSLYVGGQYKTYKNFLENNSSVDSEITEKFSTFKIVNYVTKGLAIGCGTWFAVELIRYLMAANTVLPASAVKASDFVFYTNPNPEKSDRIETEPESRENKSEAEKIETELDETNTETKDFETSNLVENISYSE